MFACRKQGALLICTCSSVGTALGEVVASTAMRFLRWTGHHSSLARRGLLAHQQHTAAKGRWPAPRPPRARCGRDAGIVPMDDDDTRFTAGQSEIFDMLATQCRNNTAITSSA